MSEKNQFNEEIENKIHRAGGGNIGKLRPEAFFSADSEQLITTCVPKDGGKNEMIFKVSAIKPAKVAPLWAFGCN